jgi:opacity protein-like surface antigen
MKIICALALSLVVMPVLADNNQGYYLGIGATSIKDIQDGSEDITRIQTNELLGGYKYNDALGLELRLGRGQKAGSRYYELDKDGAKLGHLKRDISGYQSIYYRSELVNDEAKLYALIGYSQLKSELMIQNINEGEKKITNERFSGLSYGVGVGFVVGEQLNLNLEYKVFCDDIGNDFNAGSLNLDYRF